MSKKFIPQFELPGVADVFNLRGDVQAAPEIKPQPREDLTLEMFAADPEAQLREIWRRKGVPPGKQNQIIHGIKRAAAAGAYVGPFRIPHVTKGDLCRAT